MKLRKVLATAVAGAIASSFIVSAVNASEAGSYSLGNNNTKYYVLEGTKSLVGAVGDLSVTSIATSANADAVDGSKVDNYVIDGKYKGGAGASWSTVATLGVSADITLKSDNKMTVYITTDGIDISSGKKITDVKLNVNLEDSTSGTPQTVSIEVKGVKEITKSDITLNEETKINLNAISLSNRQKDGLDAAGKIELVIAVGSDNGGAKMVYKVEGEEKQEVSNIQNEVRIDLTEYWNERYDEFDIETVTVLAEGDDWASIIGATLQYSGVKEEPVEEPGEEPGEEPVEEPGEPEPPEDIVVTPPDAGAPNDGTGDETDTNPSAGVGIAVVPAVIAMAAAAVSRKRK